jgi:hypothetical protein
MLRLICLILSCALLTLSSAYAAPEAPAVTDGAPKKDSPERGWFYFEDPPVATEAKPAPAPEAKPPEQAAKPEPKKDKCVKKDTWEPDCGFVVPGDDFAFQSKQRDALLERMSVSKNDPKAVEAFQKYMRWVLERTAEVTNLWWYNMVQNPDLDPVVSSPVSAFGIKLMTEVQKNQEKEIFDLLTDEGAMYVFFSRSDCAFCHQMAGALSRLSEQTHIPVRNAALDEKCIPGFESGCMTAPDTLAPAQSLNVTTVPSVFLYVPSSHTWLRIATGIVDQISMANRTSQFFMAYRTAMLKGVENGEGAKASVDFSGNGPNGATKVGTSTAKPVLPSEADLRKMLGAGNSK